MPISLGLISSKWFVWQWHYSMEAVKGGTLLQVIFTGGVLLVWALTITFFTHVFLYPPKNESFLSNSLKGEETRGE